MWHGSTLFGAVKGLYYNRPWCDSTGSAFTVVKDVVWMLLTAMSDVVVIFHRSATFL